MEHPINESGWRRGWQDTRHIWTSWQFFVLDAVVGVIVGGVFTWYWGLTIVALGMFFAWIVATSSAPVKQRNDLRKQLIELKNKLADAGYIEAFMIDGIEQRNKLKYWKSEGLALDDYELNQFRNWYNDISKYLQKNMNPEFPHWYQTVDIGLTRPNIDDIIKAYDSGIDILRDIFKTLTS